MNCIGSMAQTGGETNKQLVSPLSNKHQDQATSIGALGERMGLWSAEKV